MIAPRGVDLSPGDMALAGQPAMTTDVPALGTDGAMMPAAAGAPSVGPAGAAGAMAVMPKDPPAAWDPKWGTHIDHATKPGADSVRFIAVGDTGTGAQPQQAVADAMADKCARDGCDFVILLGDNIYDSGPRSADDAQWQTKFEDPYAAIDVPFYAVLGNHDVATIPLIGVGYDEGKSVAEVEYSQHSLKWQMPDTFYALSAGLVGFIMIDTPSLYQHTAAEAEQNAWVDAARSALASRHAWVISAGHHTYVSNGSDHGNAGSYGGLLNRDDGSEIKRFFDTHLCGEVDVVLTGHDHTRQWLEPSLCAGSEVIVSGAGAKTSGLSGRNATFFESLELGFLYVVATESQLKGQFITQDGVIDYERVITR
ncbi:MAG TPA: metallophosphoesterase [Polyangiales bacterium]|nr:metallophosphoesterase [Polyangiales bacterium]